MNDLINVISELIYVAQLDTYELLYINAAGKRKFGVREYRGRKCYELLQGRNSPCPFCTNRRLREDSFYIWEHENAVLGEYYLLKDKKILWEGRAARMEIALDITKQVCQRKALRNALAVETFILECVRDLERAETPDRMLPEMLCKLGRFMKAERVYIFAIRGERMDNTYEWCAPGVRSEKENLQGLDISLLERWRPAFEKQKCLIIGDLESIRTVSPQEYEILRAQEIRRLVAVPLELNGALVGYIGADNPAAEKIAAISPIFNTLGYFIVSTLQRIRAQQRLERLSYTDTLTGLNNRNRFITDIQQPSLLNRPLGVVFLDINGLKKANDSFGHQRGDELLLGTAAKLREVFAASAVYRVGGDEFVALCSEMAAAFAGKVRRLKELFRADAACQAAVGSSWEERPANVQQLIAKADQAMYEDKKLFYRCHPVTGRYRYQNDDMLGLTLPGALQENLAAGRFLVYYQPKVSFADRALVGAEALVRYRRDDGTIVAPDHFIPLLERTGLIGQLDFYMFASVCAQLEAWRAAGRRLYPVAVNFSRFTIAAEGFQQRLEALWEARRLEKRLVEIEVTERVEETEMPHLLARLRALQQAGFLLSIDDFGVQQANLSLFIAMDFDVLKLDKSLLQDLTKDGKAYAVIRSLVELCRRMRITVVAEGVETEASFALLRELGCDIAQGYLFSRPLPLAAYEAMLENAR